MKRHLRIVVVLILLGSLTIQADPFKEWNWAEPTEYENNVPIPSGDDLTYTLYCGTTEGGPYDAFSTNMDKPPPQNIDMAPLVGNNPGTYYCVATARSSIYGTESGFSNEANFTVTSGDLGYVPRPPDNLTLQ